MGGRGGSSGAGGGGGNIAPIQTGEEAYVRLPKNWLNKDGQVVVAKDKDGNYIYKVGFDKTESKIDTNSSEYKKALSRFNVHAQFKSDGSVTVTKGGLYSRKQNFKTTEAFQKDANKKLDSWKSYYNKNADSTKKGIISQLEAETLKSSIKNSTPSDALKKFGNSLKASIKSDRTYAEAAQDMKERLNATIRNKVKR